MGDETELEPNPAYIRDPRQRLNAEAAELEYEADNPCHPPSDERQREILRRLQEILNELRRLSDPPILTPQPPIENWDPDPPFDNRNPDPDVGPFGDFT